MSKVNLDALILREDFEIKDESKISFEKRETGHISDLEPNTFFYLTLRKPDFQRETAEWDHKKIVDFVQSFLNGDLIPAIILWNSGNQVFVIDGAHRLSALIAWVHDDYGDGEISRAFFEHRIPDEQVQAAEQTRRLVKRVIGTYKDHKFAILNPNKVKAELVEQAQRLGSLAWKHQWVQGDASKAEASFFKINQQAAPINKTELMLLESRKKPDALAARAIIRSGTGHKYWSKFSEATQQTIQGIAKEVNEILFNPPLRTPVKTLDLPMAGSVYSGKALSSVFDLITLANEERLKSKLLDDQDGTETIKFLKNTRKVVYRISGTHSSSLGFHPAVYSYSSTGVYQPTSLLAVARLAKEFERKSYFKTFTENREKLEKFLLKHKDIQNQVAVKHGAGVNKKGYIFLSDLYLLIIELFSDGKTEAEILATLQEDNKFSFLKWTAGEVDFFEFRRDFTSETKSAAFLREALKSPMRCQICKGLIHFNSISTDHIVRKQDGGLGVIENAQLAHLYCNSTFKN